MIQKYTYFQAKKHINSSIDTNYIARAITPWHALGVEASVKYLESKYGIRLFGYVIILPHYLTGYAIDEKYFSNISAKVIRIDSHNKRSFISTQFSILQFIFKRLFIRNRGRDFFIISPLCFDISFFALLNKRLGSVKPNFVRIDEGVAYYMSTGKRRPFKSKNFFIQLKNYLIHFENVVGDNLINKYKFIDTTLFLQDKCGLLKKNEIIYSFYRELFKKEKDCYLDANKPYVIICTTAWNRIDIKDDDDLRVLIEISKILNNFGYEIRLKSHPRDKFFIQQISNLSAKLIEGNNSSIEAILENTTHKPACVISFSSTVLVTANLFWSIKTVCLSNLLNREKISPVYLEEIDSFKSTFENFSLFPNSLDDFSDFLNNLQAID